VRLALIGGGNPEYLRAKQSSEWQRHVQECDGFAAEIEGRARAAGVPLVATFVPERAEAAMISIGEWPAAYDPYKLDGQLRSIIVSHGGTYLDILPGYRAIPDPEQGYFPVDGHPNASGHAILSGLLAKELTGGAVPALRVTATPQIASEQGK